MIILRRCYTDASKQTPYENNGSSAFLTDSSGHSRCFYRWWATAL